MQRAVVTAPTQALLGLLSARSSVLGVSFAVIWMTRASEVQVEMSPTERARFLEGTVKSVPRGLLWK